jgi:hypothetical protein
MAIITTKRLLDGNQTTDTNSSEEIRETWFVQTDSDSDNANDVLLDPSIPAKGAAHPDFSSATLRERTPVRISKRKWVVELRWSSASSASDTPDDTSQTGAYPTSIWIPPTVRTIRERRVAEAAYERLLGTDPSTANADYGQLPKENFINTAGTPFQSPPEVDVLAKQIEVSRYQHSLLGINIPEMVLNNDVVTVREWDFNAGAYETETYEKHKVLLMNIDAEWEYLQWSTPTIGENWFVKVTYSFYLSPLPIYERILNQGIYKLLSSPPRRVRIRDESTGEEITEPVPLDINGAPIDLDVNGTFDPDDFEYIRFRTRPAINFATYGLQTINLRPMPS